MQAGGGGVGLPGPWDLDWDGCEWLVEQGRGDYGWLWTLSVAGAWTHQRP